MNDDNPPAFPRDERYLGHNGMTLRDWFAGQAVQAVSAPEPLIGVATAGDIDSIARCAYQIADAMLRIRKESKPCS